VARTWLQIKVELEGGRDIECDPPAGRLFIVGPSHSFAQLAEAIDAAFARWDLSHLHAFELADGRRVGFADIDPDEHGWLDHETLKVASEVKPGEEFGYVFDLGDDWRHRCRVLPDKLDPREEYGPGPLPSRPVPIFGWGWIPDQYGRESDEELEFDG
jgi:Plasmid pRiA4b ORF-3-like protein